MIKVLSVVAAAALMTATGALAADPEAEAPKEKKICKSEKITGSLTRVRRTCMTQAEWDAVNAAARQGTDDMIRDSQNRSNAGAGTLSN